VNKKAPKPPKMNEFLGLEDDDNNA